MKTKESGERIRSTRKAAERSTTIRDVARLAAVSVGTVSRSLNLPATVRPATLAKVQAAIAALNFRPDSRAQNMRRRNTMTVGFVVDDITNPLHAETFKAADAQMRLHGYSLYLVNTRGRAEDESVAIDMLQHGRADGVIMTINSEADERTRKLMGQLRIPSVLLDRDIPLEIDAVLTDHAAGMMQAANYLIGMGHRRIALLSASTEIRPGRERLRGFVEAFQRNGLPVPEDLIRARNLSVEFGLHEANLLLGSAAPPTAMIAAGNRILVGVLKAVQQRGLRIPQDLSLISCDKTDLSLLYPGSITLIDRDIHEIGSTAAQFLLERLKHAGGPARRMVVPTRLILGGSCARIVG